MKGVGGWGARQPKRALPLGKRAAVCVRAVPLVRERVHHRPRHRCPPAHTPCRSARGWRRGAWSTPPCASATCTSCASRRSAAATCTTGAGAAGRGLDSLESGWEAVGFLEGPPVGSALSPAAACTLPTRPDSAPTCCLWRALAGPSSCALSRRVSRWLVRWPACSKHVDAGAGVASPCRTPACMPCTLIPAPSLPTTPPACRAGRAARGAGGGAPAPHLPPANPHAHAPALCRPARPWGRVQRGARPNGAAPQNPVEHAPTCGHSLNAPCSAPASGNPLPIYKRRRLGWGYFTVRAEVTLRPEWGGGTLHLQWLLDFDGTAAAAAAAGCPGRAGC